MNLLFPGRHHLLTDFQFKYLYRLVQNGLQDELDVNGQPFSESISGIQSPDLDASHSIAAAHPLNKEKHPSVSPSEPQSRSEHLAIDNIIFAVTSANHSNTRRNPIPFHLRAMAILDFSQELGIPCFVYPIDDVGHLDDFAGYTLKKIKHDSDGRLNLNPDNTVVACSSPVLNMYEAIGFRILPAELEDRESGKLSTASPWELVERVAEAGMEWRKDRVVFDKIHQASYLIWSQYGLGEKVQKLFSDDMISADGDLTESRDYGSYVREMDEIAELKYKETAPFLRPGRIGDIGCAVGTWIKMAAKDPRLRESDFFGIEVAQHLYRICQQRKENGEFPHPYIFFAQKNAVTGLCFDPNSMNTIHTSSLTHEIESYGGRDDLLQFIQNRFAELAPGGVWVNRDVLGPDEPDKQILLKLCSDDGRNDDWEREFGERDELKDYLNGLSTRALFLRFAHDFRREEGFQFDYSWKVIGEDEYAETTLGLAMEFISKKDYHSNWMSEMHETFCYWSYADWERELEKAGFVVDSKSKAYTNQWLVKNRYQGKADLFHLVDGRLKPLAYPVTHALIMAEKRI